VKSQDPATAGEAVEMLCMWAGMAEPAWGRLLAQEDVVLQRMILGAVRLLHIQELAAVRNAAIFLHCFSLDERGQNYLSLMEPAELRLFLTGLRNLRENSSDSATADLCNSTLCNLEDMGPPCWRRWQQSIDLNQPIVTYPQWENVLQTNSVLEYPQS
jgi:hypothetical protein